MKKVLFTILLCITCTHALWAWEGKGTASDPWLIQNLDDWITFCEQCKTHSYFGIYFKLTTDLDVGDHIVGAEDKQNGCCFDGGGHKITVKAETEDENTESRGLFYYKDGGWIKNLSVEGSIKGSGYVGGLIGTVASTSAVLIENCHINMTVSVNAHGHIVEKPWYQPNEVTLKAGLVVGECFSHDLTIRGCLVEGKLNRGFTYEGIFVGHWVGSMVPNVRIEDCLAINIISGVIDYSEYHDHFMLIGSTTTNNRSSNMINSYCTATDAYEQKLEPTNQYAPCSVESSNNKVGLNFGEVKATYNVAGITSYTWNTGEGTVQNGLFFRGKHYLNPYSDHYVQLVSPGRNIRFVQTELDGTEFTKVGGNNYRIKIVQHNDQEFIITQTFARLLTGQGTEASPYVISDYYDWESFAASVNDGNDYSGKTLRLEADVSGISLMVGTREKPFRGTFLGNGHTLQLDIDEQTDLAAPFRSIDGATIQDLTITGTVGTTARQAAMLVGSASGDNTIESCTVSGVLNSSYDGEAGHGGIVARIDNGTTTIRNTIFSGKMIGETTSGVGGFAGWINASKNTLLKIENSLFAPSEISMSATGSGTFARNSNPDKGLDCRYDAYFLQQFGTKQGYKLYDLADQNIPDDMVCKRVTALDCNTYWAEAQLEVKQLKQRYFTNGGESLYLGEAVWVNNEMLTPYEDYTVVDRPSQIGDYTLRLQFDGNYRGLVTTNYTFKVMAPISGEGTAKNPFIISNEEEWKTFVYNINVDQNNHYYGDYVRLTGDITTSEMVGIDETNSFQGIFDGQGHTITFNYDATTDICAPFRYTKSATIKNLQVDGTITTNKPYASGLVGCSYGDLNVKACRVKVHIHSLVEEDDDAEAHGYHGGLLAMIADGNAVFTDCMFDGLMTTFDNATENAQTDRCGGFVGDPGAGVVTLQNCYFNMASDPRTHNMGDGTFTRQGEASSEHTIDNCYYTRAFGEAQGTQTYKTGDELRTLLGDGWWNYRGEVLPIMHAFTLEGQGTKQSPYVISDYYDWTVFVRSLEENHSYAGEFVQLTGNVNIGGLMAADTCPFCGTFLGNGKTLTLQLGTADTPIAEDYVAPFRNTYYATFKDLHVNGTINQSADNKYAAAIVAHAEDNTIIEGCWFDGSILGCGSNSGGFVAQVNKISYGVKLKNCLFNPSQVPADATNSSTLVEATAVSAGNATTDDKCYYTKAFGTAQGQQVVATVEGEQQAQAVTAADGKTYYLAATVSLPYVVWCEGNHTLYFLLSTNMEMETGDTYDGQPVTKSWKGNSVVQTTKNIPWNETDVSTVCTRVVFDESYASQRPTVTESWFKNFKKLETIEGLEHLNTSEVKNTTSMFESCESLTSIDVSHFNTAKVEYMGKMFSYCSALRQVDVSGFDTSNARYMFGMFSNCFALEKLDVSHFDTHNVVSMAQMFETCRSLQELDVSNFSTSKVTSMQEMFAWCSGLKELDLSSFDTGNTTDMSFMFAADQLETIYVGEKWNTDKVTSHMNMFNDCTKLVGGAGTTFSSGNKDKAYAHVDGGADNPGYLTASINIADKADNSDLLQQYDGNKAAVTLQDRTLFKNGSWNTLCLPFNAELADSPLAGDGVELKTLASATFDNGTLSLRFVDASSIEAGVPYVIRWKNTGEHIVNPRFLHATITAQAHPVTTEALTLVGTFSPVVLTANDDTKLLVGEGNRIYHPTFDVPIYSCHAYIQLKDGITAGSISNIIIDWGDNTTGIEHIANGSSVQESGHDSWFTLDGRQLNQKPHKKGVYIRNGQKVVVK